MDFGRVPDNNLKGSFIIFFYSRAFYTLCIFHSTVDLTCKCFSKSVIKKRWKKKNTEKIKTQCWLYVIRIFKKIGDIKNSCLFRVLQFWTPGWNYKQLSTSNVSKLLIVIRSFHNHRNISKKLNTIPSNLLPQIKNCF